MIPDRLVEAGVWAVALLLLIVLVPADKRREAALSIVFMQFIAWILGLLAVETDLLSYPVRFFSTATSASFTFEFCALPIVGAIYNVNFPTSSAPWRRWAYAAAFPTALTAIEYPIERYTELIEYIHWHWSWTWISEFVVLIGCRMFYDWFYRRRPVVL